MLLQRTVDTYCGMYDFATTGGAVGSYDLQVPIPKNVCITRFYAIPIIALTSATSSALITFDRINISVNPITTIVGALMQTASFATSLTPFLATFGIDGAGALISLDGAIVNTPVLNFSSMLNVAGVTGAISIGMSISIEPLTSGRILVCAEGNIFDLPQ